MFQLGVIVATKDRPEDLRSMLESLADQTVPPAQVVIVDASEEPVDAVAAAFEERLTLSCVRHWPPSAAAQRNAGLTALQDGITLVGFMDDDIVLAPDAMERMLAFWNREGERLGGAALNWMNIEPRAMARLKTSRFVSMLGLYSDRPGGVAPSGWQAIVEGPEETVWVDWLSSCASVWRRDVFDRFSFDPFFDGYSYLEDLDFSYTVGREYHLAVVADAKFWHYPAKGGRISRFHFGRVEVRNRLYFVRKHGLSTLRCYLAILVRMSMTLARGVGRWDRGSMARAGGNMAGTLDRLLGSETGRRTVSAAGRERGPVRG